MGEIGLDSVMPSETQFESSGETASQWIARLAAELDVEPLTLQRQAAVLALARDVAHGTERKYAPLASFVAGCYVQRALHDGRNADEALADVSAAVARLLGPSATH